MPNAGADQAQWGIKEVDLSAEMAQVLVLCEPPLNAAQPQVERSIISARGNMADAAEVHATGGV